MKNFLEKKENILIVRRCAYRVYNSNYNLFKSKSIDYEDFVQDIYVKLLTVDIKDKELTNQLLFAIIFSKIKTLLNKLKRIPTFVEDRTSATSDFDMSAVYKNVIADFFEPKESYILVEKIFNEKTYNDIGKSLGQSKQSVFKIYKSSIIKLRELFLSNSFIIKG